MTKKPRRRLPYVGDPDFLVAGDLPQKPEAFKTDQPCAVCGAAFAPFGGRDPSSINSEYTWYCRQHVEAVMPEIPEKLDEQRFDKILNNALLIANLWLAVALAAKRKDKPSAWTACSNIQTLNKATFPLVKELGMERAREAAKPEVDEGLIP